MSILSQTYLVPSPRFRLSLAAAVFLCLFGCNQKRLPTTVPDFVLPEVRGGSFHLRAEDSSAILLAFLQTVPDTADTPSRRQAGLLMSLQRQFSTGRLQVVVVDSSALLTHRPPGTEALINASYDWQLQLPLLVDEGNHLARSLGIDQVPSFLLLAPDGDIVERWSGLTGPASLAASIRPLIATSGSA